MSITDIKKRNAEVGQYFFSESTMRFFNSRVHEEVFGDGYFVTSEQFVGSNGVRDTRKYTIRKLHENGGIETVGLFQEYASKAEAVFAIRNLTDKRRGYHDTAK